MRAARRKRSAASIFRSLRWLLCKAARAAGSAPSRPKYLQTRLLKSADSPLLKLLKPDYAMMLHSAHGQEGLVRWNYVSKLTIVTWESMWKTEQAYSQSGQHPQQDVQLLVTCRSVASRSVRRRIRVRTPRSWLEGAKNAQVVPKICHMPTWRAPRFSTGHLAQGQPLSSSCRFHISPCTQIEGRRTASLHEEPHTAGCHGARAPRCGGGLLATKSCRCAGHDWGHTGWEGKLGSFWRSLRLRERPCPTVGAGFGCPSGDRWDAAQADISGASSV